MTENERFTYCPFDGFEDNGKGLDSNEVLELLNELADENEQLKQRIQQLEDNIVTKLNIIQGDVE